MVHDWKVTNTSETKILWQCRNCKATLMTYDWEDDPKPEWKVRYPELSNEYLSCDEIIVGQIISE